MPIDEIAVTSHTAASMLFLVLAVFFLRPWRDGIYSPIFIIASLITALWHFSTPSQAPASPVAHLQALSTLHSVAWIMGLVATLMLNISDESSHKNSYALYAMLVVFGLVGAIYVPYLISDGQLSVGIRALTWNSLLLGLLGIVVVEQVVRNTLDRQKQAVSFLCAGAALFFVFDVVVYSNALLFSRVDPTINEFRPIINLIAAISLIFATTRTNYNNQVSISRKAVFYSASLIVAGIFLFTMAATAYYVRIFGGSWGMILQAGLLIGASVGLILVFASPDWRASMRVFINKHFFLHKYDYRTEWLNLINILSQPSSAKDEKEIAIEAACSVFHGDQAQLWLRVDNEYHHSASTALENVAMPSVSGDSDFCEILASDWVFHPVGRSRTNDTNNAALPDWVFTIPSVWIIAPLISQQRLIGFIVLSKEEGNTNLTWEDLDVLRTVGRQLGSYLALHVAAEQLAQSKQFDTYNKLTAFIMHDLKNLIAQQALVVENAKKHKENPAFVEDAIKTIENSVTRMSTLLSKMQQRGPSSSRSLELNKILLESVNKCREKKPAPSLRMDDAAIWVTGDRDHLAMIFAHVIKNAQEATPASGFVDVFVEADSKTAVVTVEDNGQGMSEQFIKERLFRPFDTTKSGQGMGIGVFQTREYIQNLGGDVKVESSEDLGTTFTISIPVVEEIIQNV
ncbi:MAG: XrtA/PEP-CTERM system histidine kinase PrsK [Pseudomonadales bacterium]